MKVQVKFYQSIDLIEDSENVIACTLKDTLPKSLLNDYSCISTFLVSLVLLVRSVSILDDGGRFSTFLKTFLSVVTSELTLDEHSCLSHFLIVNILKRKENCLKD